MNSKLAGELIMRCFSLRTMAHIAHLQTTSYATHMALNSLYEGIIPLVDSFAETFQGDDKIITTYPTIPSKSGEVLLEIDVLEEWIIDKRHDICDPEASHLQNIIDEIMALLSSSRYKLRFLK
jgi:hypothetical protein